MGRDERIGIVVLIIAVLAVIALGVSLRNCKGRGTSDVQKIEIQTIATVDKDSAEMKVVGKTKKRTRRDSTSGKERKNGKKKSKKKATDSPRRDLLKEPIDLTSPKE